MPAKPRWRSARGQSTALIITMLWLFVLFVGMVAVVGQAVNRRIALQIVADSGAYTGAVFQRQDGFGLSPGDFDEAVTVLLRFDYAARDSKGEDAVDPGFERVARFREGVFEGPKKCGL